jgi:hypothetical protein
VSPKGALTSQCSASPCDSRSNPPRAAGSRRSSAPVARSRPSRACAAPGDAAADRQVAATTGGCVIGTTRGLTSIATPARCEPRPRALLPSVNSCAPPGPAVPPARSETFDRGDEMLVPQSMQNRPTLTAAPVKPAHRADRLQASCSAGRRPLCVVLLYKPGATGRRLRSGSRLDARGTRREF